MQPRAEVGLPGFEPGDRPLARRGLPKSAPVSLRKITHFLVIVKTSLDIITLQLDNAPCKRKSQALRKKSNKNSSYIGVNDFEDIEEAM